MRQHNIFGGIDTTPEGRTVRGIPRTNDGAYRSNPMIQAHGTKPGKKCKTCDQMSDLIKATVKATNEKINVYLLNDGDYYDYDNMSERLPPSAPKANKKRFKKEELTLRN